VLLAAEIRFSERLSEGQQMNDGEDDISAASGAARLVIVALPFLILLLMVLVWRQNPRQHAIDVAPAPDDLRIR
jgi:hypothetical protein